jgi:DNA repair exonuclease SbcCD nuclease subunit
VQPHKENIMKKNILVLGDFHFKPQLGYSDFVKDGRLSEKEEIKNFIIEQSKDVQDVVILGDLFDSKNNLSSVVKEVTAFIESFGDKNIYIISGNHEIKNDGSTALDYLAEINKPNWHIVTGLPKKVGDYMFAPYITKNILDCETNVEATKKLMGLLEDSKYLFHHFSMSGSTTQSGMSTEFFDELVLPYKQLSKKFGLTIGGHIHKDSKITNNVIVSGSIFSQEMGEDTSKIIFKIIQGEDGEEVRAIPLPGRKIFKLENPTVADLEKIDKGNIIKIIFTEKKEKEELDAIKEAASKFDASIFVENIPKKRKKLLIEEGKNISSFTIPDLIEVYSKEKNIPLEKLLAGFELIKN